MFIEILIIIFAGIIVNVVIISVFIIPLIMCIMYCKNDDMIYKCNNCNKEFSNQKLYKKHTCIEKLKNNKELSNQKNISIEKQKISIDILYTQPIDDNKVNVPDINYIPEENVYEI